MSSEDQVRPFHAKDEARGQEAAEAVAAVLKHAAEKDQSAQTKPRPKAQPKWLLPVGLQLAVLAVYLLIAPPSWVVVNPIEGPDPIAQETNLRRAMYLYSQQIEQYKIDNGRLPVDLAELGRTAPPGVEYVRQGADAYQLIAFVGEVPVMWDSTGPDPKFAEAFAGAVGRLGG
jgi:hypothetical protein